MTAPVLLRFLTLASCMKGRSWASTPQIRTGKCAETRGLRRRSIPFSFAAPQLDAARLDIARRVRGWQREENLPGSRLAGASGHVDKYRLYIGIDRNVCTALSSYREASRIPGRVGLHRNRRRRATAR